MVPFLNGAVIKKIISEVKMIIKRLLTGAIKIITLSFGILISGFTVSGFTFASENITTSVGVQSSLTLTMPTTALNLSLDPSSTTFGYKDLPISVGTNNETGFTMTVSTANDNTNLVNTADSNTVIETLPPSSPTTTGYTDADFIVNKWGYKNGLSNNYFPFQSGATVLENDTPTNEKSTTLRFATKIDYMQPEGTYSTTFNFSLVANPTYKTMQNLDPTLCTTTPTTVLDNRDMQEYTIQRLADGNCWMMTNLNLGAVALTTDLTSQNTNIDTTIDIATFEGYKKETGSGSNVNAEYIPVPGVDPAVQTIYGTVYNFCAASAGTKCGSTFSGNAQYDICPAGWRLPTGGNSGEFATLYNNSAYHSYAIALSPVSSNGLAYTLSGAFQNAGVIQKDQYGYYWSSTLQSNQRIFEVGFGGNIIDPATTAYTWANITYGFTMRCVLKES